MTDPLGLISNGASIDPFQPGRLKGPPNEALRGGPDFKNMLEEQIRQVNALQEDAKEATEDIAAGRRDDIEGVMLATQKADTAFRMLLQVRNKVMDAYDEVKQIRV